MVIGKACRPHRTSFRFHQFLSRPRGVAVHPLIKQGWEQNCVLDLSPACRPANYPEIENNLYSRHICSLDHRSSGRNIEKANRDRQVNFIALCVVSWEARWPHGLCARLRSERSGFEPWPGTLCCVLGQDTLLSQCLSPPRCINGYRRT